jgi:hypothetical protein
VYLARISIGIVDGSAMIKYPACLKLPLVVSAENRDRISFSNGDGILGKKSIGCTLNCAIFAAFVQMLSSAFSGQSLTGLLVLIKLSHQPFACCDVTF